MHSANTLKSTPRIYAACMASARLTQRLTRTSPSKIQRRSLSVSVQASQAGFNMNKCLDKKEEGKSLKEIIALPPNALQGLARGELLSVLNIKSIKDLGSYKYYKAAKAIAVLAATEEAGGRAINAASNINKILKVSYEGSSMTELLAAPVEAFQGITKEKAEAALAPLGVKTISDLAQWKYAIWAESLVTLSKYENADSSSR